LNAYRVVRDNAMNTTIFHLQFYFKCCLALFITQPDLIVIALFRPDAGQREVLLLNAVLMMVD